MHALCAVGPVIPLAHVVLGAALHRKLDAKGDVVEVILRLLVWRDWREASVVFDSEITCVGDGS